MWIYLRCGYVYLRAAPEKDSRTQTESGEQTNTPRYIKAHQKPGITNLFKYAVYKRPHAPETHVTTPIISLWPLNIKS